MNNQRMEELRQQYEQQRSIYDKFCEYLSRELREIIELLNLSYYELSYRVKSWDSILEKIERNSLQPQAISDIHDVIGFRIIALFKSDIPIVCDAVRNNLDILDEDDKSKVKPADVFGYTSIHFRIRLPEQWLLAPTSSGFSDIEAELQVRTFSQHIWAASSHILQYKREVAIPELLKRSIYRLAAVLEIVDNELDHVLQERKAYQQSLHSAESDDSQSDRLLDIIIIEEMLDKAFGEDSKKTHEPYDVLLQELSFCGIKTVGQLSDMLFAGYAAIQKLEEKLCVKSKGQFYSHAGKLRIALQFCFPKEYAEMRRIRRFS